MTPQEFKSWFDGFTEAMSGTPTKAQWARVKERVAEIDGKAVTERIYLDRYWPTYEPYWRRHDPLYLYSGTGVSTTTYCASGISQAVGQNATLSLNSNNNDLGPVFNASAALYALGRADAEAIQ